MCESCAIIGLDGTTWAASPKWKAFTEYEHTVEGEDGEIVCQVNELEIAKQASTGSRSVGNAGIRLCGQKFVMTQFNDGVA